MVSLPRPPVIQQSIMKVVYPQPDIEFEKYVVVVVVVLRCHLEDSTSAFLLLRISVETNVPQGIRTFRADFVIESWPSCLPLHNTNLPKRNPQNNLSFLLNVHKWGGCLTSTLTVLKRLFNRPDQRKQGHAIHIQPSTPARIVNCVFTMGLYDPAPNGPGSEKDSRPWLYP